MPNKKPNRVNYHCSDFPCHNENKLQDCTFCYCPLYPCLNEPLGSKGKMKELRNGKKVWDCSKCTWPHEKRRVDELVNYLKNNWE